MSPLHSYLSDDHIASRLLHSRAVFASDRNQINSTFDIIKIYLYQRDSRVRQNGSTSEDYYKMKRAITKYLKNKLPPLEILN